jgi:creatinine amidohydrolase
MKRFWAELSSPEIAALDRPRTIALLPVGAVEQHGPHLPLGTDAMINAGIVERALAMLAADVPLLVLPAMPVGKSDEHLSFSGTLTLDAETLRRLWTEIGAGVARAGIRKLVLFNSHGGQPQVMEIVARELRVRHRLVTVAYSWFAGGVPPGLFGDDEVRHGIHGGAIETSMMLHLRPDLVRMDEAADFRSRALDLACGNTLLGPTAAAKLAWRAEDLHPSGAAGNALDADAARGKALVEHAAGQLVRLLEELDRLPVDWGPRQPRRRSHAAGRPAGRARPASPPAAPAPGRDRGAAPAPVALRDP